MVENNPSRDRVWTMFDRIASRYDFLNHMLSLGQDVIWRKRVARHLKDYYPQRVLDLATGTADQIIFLCQKNKNITSAVGIDMAEKMLEIGKEKVKRKKLDHIIRLQKGDATRIPDQDESYDAVTISFGIRNVSNVLTTLQEMYRILKPGGRAIILEFSLPQNRIIRTGYLFYFRNILPRIGSVISSDPYAYNYLNKTVETFPYGEALCRMMEEAGFCDVAAKPLTFGISTIYQGDKPLSSSH